MKTAEWPSYGELEANRHSEEWGHPVQDLAVHAFHWLETAWARHPELRRTLDGLLPRLEAADNDLTDVRSDGDVVHALEQIVAIMRELAPLLVRHEALS